jgi:DNA-binding NarL/FixJ family response regulator
MKTSPNARILIIDDEEYFHRFLNNLFEGDPVEVVSCIYGHEAFAKLQKERFDFIIVDYQLPDMTGLDILQWLQDHQVETPRAMVTGYATIDVAVKALKGGAVDFFTKPLADPHAFARVLHRALNLDQPGNGNGHQVMAESKAAASVGAEHAGGEHAQHAAIPETASPAVDKVRALCSQLAPPVVLSRREYEIVATLLQGFSNKEIASALYISERTVKNHLTHIYDKFSVESRLQLFNRVFSNQQ